MSATELIQSAYQEMRLMGHVHIDDELIRLAGRQFERAIIDELTTWKTKTNTAKEPSKPFDPNVSAWA